MIRNTKLNKMKLIGRILIRYQHLMKTLNNIFGGKRKRNDCSSELCFVHNKPKTQIQKKITQMANLKKLERKIPRPRMIYLV